MVLIFVSYFHITLESMSTSTSTSKSTYKSTPLFDINVSLKRDAEAKASLKRGPEEKLWLHGEEYSTSIDVLFKNIKKGLKAQMRSAFLDGKADRKADCKSTENPRVCTDSASIDLFVWLEKNKAEELLNAYGIDVWAETSIDVFKRVFRLLYYANHEDSTNIKIFSLIAFLENVTDYMCPCGTHCRRPNTDTEGFFNRPSTCPLIHPTSNGEQLTGTRVVMYGGRSAVISYEETIIHGTTRKIQEVQSYSATDETQLTRLSSVIRIYLRENSFSASLPDMISDIINEWQLMFTHSPWESYLRPVDFQIIKMEFLHCECLFFIPYVDSTKSISADSLSKSLPIKEFLINLISLATAIKCAIVELDARNQKVINSNIGETNSWWLLMLPNGQWVWKHARSDGLRRFDAETIHNMKIDEFEQFKKWNPDPGNSERLAEPGSTDIYGMGKQLLQLLCSAYGLNPPPERFCPGYGRYTLLVDLLRSGCPKSWVSFISFLLNEIPEARPNIEEITRIIELLKLEERDVFREQLITPNDSDSPQRTVLGIQHLLSQVLDYVSFGDNYSETINTMQNMKLLHVSAHLAAISGLNKERDILRRVGVPEPLIGYSGNLPYGLKIGPRQSREALQKLQDPLQPPRSWYELLFDKLSIFLSRLTHTLFQSV
jgi:hypothetical protein